MPNVIAHINVKMQDVCLKMSLDGIITLSIQASLTHGLGCGQVMTDILS